MDELKTDYDRADCLVNILIDRATTPSADEDTFLALRAYFLAEDPLAQFLPSWFARHRSLEQFWRHIKNKFGTYKERREFLWSEFEKLLAYCEKGEQFPAETDISEGLTSFDSSSVNRTWRSMIRRQDDDPEGAKIGRASCRERV